MAQWSGVLSGSISFPDLLPVQRADVEQHLGEDGWRQLDEAGFDDLLRDIKALDLSS